MTGEESRGSAGGADLPWTPPALTAIRSRPRWRAGALLVAAAAGLALAWAHWLGLFVAGALVGLFARTLRGALVSGVVLGGLVLVLQVLLIPGMDTGEFLALRPPVYVTAGAGIAAPAWGALVRAVV